MTIEIPLSRGLVALVDDADADLVLSFGKWYADVSYKTHYARRNYWTPDGRCRSLRMHRVLMSAALVDHINGDGLDNRRSNLRVATSSQNAMNRGLRSDNSCGFTGVSFRRTTGRWTAEITTNGRRHYLGTFTSAIDAALAYDAAAIELFGEFARPNFPKEIAA